MATHINGMCCLDPDMVGNVGLGFDDRFYAYEGDESEVSPPRIVARAVSRPRPCMQGVTMIPHQSHDQQIFGPMCYNNAALAKVAPDSF